MRSRIVVVMGLCGAGERGHRRRRVAATILSQTVYQAQRQAVPVVGKRGTTNDDLDAHACDHEVEKGGTAGETARIAVRLVIPRPPCPDGTGDRHEEPVGDVTQPLPATVNEIFDPEPLLEMVDGDLEFVTQLVGTLKTTIQGAMVKLREATAAGDADGLRVAAHTLKGSVAHFGAQEVVERSLRLERLGRDGDVDSAATEIDDLDGCVAALLVELASFAEGRAEPGSQSGARGKG